MREPIREPDKGADKGADKGGRIREPIREAIQYRNLECVMRIRTHGDSRLTILCVYPLT